MVLMLQANTWVNYMSTDGGHLAKFTIKLQK